MLAIRVLLGPAGQPNPVPVTALAAAQRHRSHNTASGKHILPDWLTGCMPYAASMRSHKHCCSSALPNTNLRRVLQVTHTESAALLLPGYTDTSLHTLLQMPHKPEKRTPVEGQGLQPLGDGPIVTCMARWGGCLVASSSAAPFTSWAEEWSCPPRSAPWSRH